MSNMDSKTGLLTCLKQQNGECTMTSLAMLIHKDKATADMVTQLYAMLGHRNKNVHIQEVVDVAYKHKIGLIAIDARPAMLVEDKQVECYNEPTCMARLNHYLIQRDGLIYQQIDKYKAHMVYWDHETRNYWDPGQGLIFKSLPSFVRTFYAAFPL